MNDINTTPLVDVMLVLLVIFIITAPLLNQAVPVDLPRAESTAIDQNPKALQLSIDDKGVFFVNGVATAFEAIERTMRDKLPSDVKSPELHLRADRQTPYEQVAHAMAAANKAGITKISFVTESPMTDNDKNLHPIKELLPDILGK